MLRLSTQNDLPFVYNSWLESYRENAGPVPKYVYFKEQHRLITRLLEKGTCTVACNDTDPEQIFGYIVHQGNSVHWAYVKKTYRKLGIGKQLRDSVKDDVIFYTHDTRCKWFATENHVYNPYLLRA